MKLLAIDTSSYACTVAVMVDADVDSRFEITKNEHSKIILGMVEELMANFGIEVEQLDAIAFGRGPGSFTGLRIAAGVVQGIAFAYDKPVIPVSSMAVIAQGIQADNIAVAVDARMQQIYCGCYQRQEDGLVTMLGEERVLDPDQFVIPKGGQWVGAGTGWDQYADSILKHNSATVSKWLADCYPHAEDILKLGRKLFAAGEFKPAHEALPVYIRNEVAKRPV